MNKPERRILRAYELASDSERDDGHAWYFDANDIARTNFENESIGAGIIAALSPRLSWTKNVEYALELLRTGTTRGLRTNVEKAERILAGERPVHVLGGKKVRSFYENILHPGTSFAVTIDRHAYSLYHGTYSSDAPLLGKVGTYERIVDAFTRTSKEVGVLPSQIQAVTWLVWRRLLKVKGTERVNG